MSRIGNFISRPRFISRNGARLFFALAAAALIAALPLGARPAAADSFYFGARVGGGPHYPYYPGYYPYRPPHYYRPRPSVIYYPPPVYYAPPPPAVIYAPPPVYAANPALNATPTSPVYQNANGQYCREYQSSVTVNGAPQPSYGTACLQPDGSWRVVN